MLTTVKCWTASHITCVMEVWLTSCPRFNLFQHVAHQLPYCRGLRSTTPSHVRSDGSHDGVRPSCSLVSDNQSRTCCTERPWGRASTSTNHCRASTTTRDHSPFQRPIHVCTTRICCGACTSCSHGGHGKSLFALLGWTAAVCMNSSR